MIVKILAIIRIFTKIYFPVLSKVPAKYTNAERIGQFSLFYPNLPQLAGFFLRGYLVDKTTLITHKKFSVMTNKKALLPWWIWPF